MWERKGAPTAQKGARSNSKLGVHEWVVVLNIGKRKFTLYFLLWRAK